MFRSYKFSFAEQRKINKVLQIIDDLSEKDTFFRRAKADFDRASKTEQEQLAESLLRIYNQAKEDGKTVENVLYLACF